VSEQRIIAKLMNTKNSVEIRKRINLIFMVLLISEKLKIWLRQENKNLYKKHVETGRRVDYATNKIAPLS